MHAQYDSKCSQDHLGLQSHLEVDDVQDDVDSPLAAQSLEAALERLA
jgi:hypothetical protein